MDQENNRRNIEPLTKVYGHSISIKVKWENRISEHTNRQPGQM